MTQIQPSDTTADEILVVGLECNALAEGHFAGQCGSTRIVVEHEVPALDVFEGLLQAGDADRVELEPPDPTETVVHWRPARTAALRSEWSRLMPSHRVNCSIGLCRAVPRPPADLAVRYTYGVLHDGRWYMTIADFWTAPVDVVAALLDAHPRELLQHPAAHCLVAGRSA